MNPWLRAARRLLAQPAFVAAVVILATSAITLNAAVGFLKLHFKKLAVPLAVRSLKEGLPQKFGDHWIQVSKDQALDGQTEEVLGTHEYVFRDYADSRILSNEEIALLVAATGGEYESLFSQQQMRHPLAFMRVAVTYYTGMVDTVAHVPDRCYVADGYAPTSYRAISRPMGAYPNGQPRNVEFRFISFEDQTGTRKVSRNVGYVFHVNGEYHCNPFEVRFKLQDLREPYGYYAKVELMTQLPAYKSNDESLTEESVKAMSDFFESALPSVEKCLPDWKALHARAAAPQPGTAAK